MANMIWLWLCWPCIHTLPFCVPGERDTGWCPKGHHLAGHQLLGLEVVLPKIYLVCSLRACLNFSGSIKERGRQKSFHIYSKLIAAVLEQEPALLLEIAVSCSESADGERKAGPLPCSPLESALIENSPGTERFCANRTRPAYCPTVGKIIHIVKCHGILAMKTRTSLKYCWQYFKLQPALLMLVQEDSMELYLADRTDLRSGGIFLPPKYFLQRCFYSFVSILLTFQ